MVAATQNINMGWSDAVIMKAAEDKRATLSQIKEIIK
jgi:hypothetical protein